MATAAFSASDGAEQKSVFQTLSSKFSATDPNQIAQLMHNLQLPATTALMRRFVDSSSLAEKGACLVAIIGVYTDKPIVASIASYSGAFDDIGAFFSLITSKNKDEPKEDPSMDQHGLIDPEVTATVTYDPKAGSAAFIEGHRKEPMIHGFLTKNVKAVRTVCAALSLLACVFGIHKALSCDNLKKLVVDITALSGLIGGGKNVMSAIGTFTDSIMSIGYNFFGVEYVRPEFQELSTLAAKIDKLTQECRQFSIQMKTDFLGVHREGMEELQRRYSMYQKEVAILTSQQQSMFNFAQNLSICNGIISSIIEAYTNLLKTCAGKQQPTVLWFAGSPGVGKTHLMGEIASQLCADGRSSRYDRMCNDQFWSGYYNQQVVCYDDILQRIEGNDVDEFHKYSSENSVDVVGAGLEDKGRPFTSRFILCTSNYLWIAPPCKLSDFLALNRRRHLVIFAHNPYVSQYRANHFGEAPKNPKWWEEHPTEYYLIDPTFGYDLDNLSFQSNLKFNPLAPYVIKKTTLDQVVYIAKQHELFFREQFRKKMLNALKDCKVTTIKIVEEPFKYDEKAVFGDDQQEQPKPQPEACSKSSRHSSIKACDLDCLHTTVLDGQKFNEWAEKGNFILCHERPFTDPKQSPQNFIQYWVIPKPGACAPTYFAYKGNIVGYIDDQGKYSQISDWATGVICRTAKIGMRILNFTHQPSDYTDENGNRSWYMNMEMVEVSDPSTDPQSNMFYDVIKRVVTPATILFGPPGCGKTYFCDLANVYKVKYEDEEEYPSDKMLLFDDFTVSTERLQIFKKAVGKFYDANSGKWLYILGTGNKKTAAWAQLEQNEHDVTMLLRRSHVLDVDFTTTTRMYAAVAGLTAENYAAKYEGAQFEALLTFKFTPVQGRDPSFYTLPASYSTIRQVIQIEQARSKEETDRRDYKPVVLPMPEKPDAILVLNHDTNPQPYQTKVMLLRPDGRYEQAVITEHIGMLSKLIACFSKVHNLSIADRSTSVMTINQAQIKSTLPLDTVVVQAPTWSTGFCTINGCIHAFCIDKKKRSRFQFHDDGMYDNEAYYPYERPDDVLIGQAVARVYGLDANFANPIKQFDAPTLQECAKKAGPNVLIKHIIGVVDIVLTMMTVGALMKSTKEEQKAIEVTEEGSDKDFDRCQLERGKSAHQQKRGQKAEYSARYWTDEQPPEDYQLGEVMRDGKGNYTWFYDETTRQWKKMYVEALARLMPKDKKVIQLKRFEGEIVPSTAYVAVIQRGSRYTGRYEEYGVLYQGQLFIFTQLHADPRKWVLYAFDSAENHTIPLFEATKPVNRALLNHLKGTVIECEEGIDFSSVFAHYVCFGTFLDIELQKTHPELEQKLVALGPMHDTDHRNFGMRNQGMVDRESIMQLARIYKQMVDVVGVDDVKVQHAVMIKQHYGITNAHAGKDPRIRYKDCIYETKTYSYDGANDVQIFQLVDKSVNHFPDITNTIPSRDDLATYFTNSNRKFAGLLPIIRDQILITQAVHGTVACKLVEKKGEKGQMSYVQRMSYLGNSGVTASGDCGMPLVLTAPTLNAKWVSIHARGCDDLSMGMMITREYINDLLTKQESLETQSAERHPDVVYDGLEYQRCPLTGLLLVGKTSMPIFTPTDTACYRTPFPGNTFEPTVKSPDDPRNIFKIDTLKEGLARYGGQDPTGIEEEVKFAAQQVGNYLAQVIKTKDLSTRILTNTEAINGAPREEFISSKPCNRNGSAGFPAVQKNKGRSNKGDYLKQNTANQKWYFKDDKPSQEILARTNYIYQRAYTGISCDEPWIAFPKDEPVKRSKIYDATKIKTRVFFGGSMPFYINYRRLFGAAMFRITEIFRDIPIKVGISPRSPQWQEMMYQFLQVGPDGFASDMENWDGTVPKCFLEGVSDVYSIIYKMTDDKWTAGDDVARRTLHKNVEGSLVIMRGTVYRLEHAIVSGFPGTAIENSIVNWMLFYCVFRRIMRGCDRDPSFATFMKTVRLGVFGDDNICSVAPGVADQFHFNSFKKVAKEFGFSVTDAAKTGLEQPNLAPVLSLEFLKRNTVYASPNSITLYSRLSPLSVEKMLTWHRGGGSYEYLGQWRRFDHPIELEKILVAAAEEYVPDGEDAYDAFVKEALGWCAQIKLTAVIPTYSEAYRNSGYGD